MQLHRPPPCRTPLTSLKQFQTCTAAFRSRSQSRTARSGRSGMVGRCAVRAGDDGDSTEQLFEKELKKRGYSIKDGQLLQGDKPVPDPRSRRGDESKRSFPGFRPPGQGQQRKDAGSDQLERSRQLNSEGLEGLIPRVTELVKLGGSFWLAFWPFMAAIATAFLALYLFTGSGFIHSGSQPMSVPEYLPRELFEDTATSGDAAPKIKLDGFEPNM